MFEDDGGGGRVEKGIRQIELKLPLPPTIGSFPRHIHSPFLDLTELAFSTNADGRIHSELVRIWRL